MSILGDLPLRHYTSRAQQAKNFSEDWVARNGYCLACDSGKLARTPANTKTRDFFCPQCDHGYELKSKAGPFGNRVLDGAYGAMLETIRHNRTPTFLLLEYTPAWVVQSFTAIHHSLITEHAIIARKPLASTARRAGWVGCNIALSAIATDGKIEVVKHTVPEPPNQVRLRFQKLQALSIMSVETRGWAGALLGLLRTLPNRSFSLAEAYAFESRLQVSYPGNHHLRAKIRQQLQILRDTGILRFQGRGRYELID